MSTIEEGAAVRVVALTGQLDRLNNGSPFAAHLRSWARDRDNWIHLWLHSSIGASAIAALIAALPTHGSGNSAGSRPSQTRAPISAVATPRPPVALAEGAAEAPAEFRLQDLTAQAAEIYNASIPISAAPNPPAKPFFLKAATEQDQLRALDCLSAAVYYEAASEPLEGQQAVAQVVLNRVRDPAYPKTVCGVVFDGSTLATGWQFSFTGDGSLARRPAPSLWQVARRVADAALHGYVAKSVGHATHYHTRWVAPYWSPQLDKVANIGGHIFYRWAGSRGLPAAFTGLYAGTEPLVSQIAALDPEVADVAPKVVELTHTAVGVSSGDKPRLVQLTAASNAPTMLAPLEIAAAATSDVRVKLETSVAVQGLTAPPPIEASPAPRARQNARIAFGANW